MRPQTISSLLLCLLGLAAGFSVSASDTAITIEPPITEDDRAHWSFQSLTRPSLPAPEAADKARNEIDLFILQRLEQKGLTLQQEADKRTLIRRLSFDLTGLPPSLEQIRTFVNDSSPKAYDQLVERLLSSSAYGERWAQHWLDVARFAESDGFEHDKVRKDAWKYRDWVITALNEDLPYDQFIQMQIAGAQLFPDRKDADLATGFLTSGPDMPDINLPEERRHTVLNEITSAVGSAVLGLGVSCAQCHDHKYDPISQADFYRLRAYFENMALPPKNKSLQVSFSESEKHKEPARIAIKGDFRKPGPVIHPDVPRIVSEAEREQQPSTRSQLAQWLTQPDNPLTGRVFINRLWMHHFGQPIVSTPNDFGTQGAKPSHPELLDWLATELPQRQWSMKAMHRLMVTSATYRQASNGHGQGWEDSLKADPKNHLFSRMPRRRLSGEAVRDAMLLISGQLNPKKGGPGFRPPLPPEVTVTLLKNQWPVTSNVSEHKRRSIYLFARRNLRFPMFAVFDRPDALASCARRDQSTTALQSLTLFNSEFSFQCSTALAELVDKGEPLNEAIQEVQERILGRETSEAELEVINSFIKGTIKNGSSQKQALADLSLGLFNVNEFLYVD